jgi:hypothetical protein
MKPKPKRIPRKIDIEGLKRTAAKHGFIGMGPINMRQARQLARAGILVGGVFFDD